MKRAESGPTLSAAAAGWPQLVNPGGMSSWTAEAQQISGSCEAESYVQPSRLGPMMARKER
jgi:hypothetical protein